jgi:hypothetical protein
VGEAALLVGSTPWSAEVDRVVLYPNPLSGQELTVRFFSKTNNGARLVLFNLEGEMVVQSQIPTVEGQNEFHLALPDLVSGLYVCHLERETTKGYEKHQVTLAVER